MGLYKITELRTQNIDGYEVLGYRINIGKKSFDFSCELLDDITRELAIYGGNYILGYPIYGKFVGDTYITDEEQGAVEISSSSEISEILSINVSCGAEDDFMEGMVLRHFLLCKQKMYDLGIQLGHILLVRVNSRLSSSWGRCRKYKPGVSINTYNHYSFEIELSKRLIDGCQDFDSVDIVIFHELLHTINGAFNHGSIWKHYASIVGYAYDYSIQRLSDAEELGLSVEDLLSQGYYACQCEGCGRIEVNKTLCNFIRHPERYRCGVCHGSFKRIQ